VDYCASIHLMWGLNALKEAQSLGGEGGGGGYPDEGDNFLSIASPIAAALNHLVAGWKSTSAAARNMEPVAQKEVRVLQMSSGAH